MQSLGRFFLVLVLAQFSLTGCAKPHHEVVESVTSDLFVNPIVELESGKVRGAHVGLKDPVLAFKGIPYAAPPVNDLRWRPPQTVASWEGIRDATSATPYCIQTNSVIGRNTVKRVESEDCLYVNVWTKAGSVTESRPVMVWVHGGGFIIGGSGDPRLDGELYARDNIVLVTFNYRLGPFGFLAHPALSEESIHGVSGNYGILDQVALLKWVQTNIDKFGGDPDNVTIFGVSAGSMSICYLNATPLAKGLFDKSIA